MTKEQVELFQSDFKIVADYFVQKQESGDYIPSSMQIRHVQETLQLLSVMSGDHRFEDVLYGRENETRRGGRLADAKRASEDTEYRHILMEELAISPNSQDYYSPFFRHAMAYGTFRCADFMVWEFISSQDTSG